MIVGLSGGLVESFETKQGFRPVDARSTMGAGALRHSGENDAAVVETDLHPADLERAAAAGAGAKPRSSQVRQRGPQIARSRRRFMNCNPNGS